MSKDVLVRTTEGLLERLGLSRLSTGLEHLQICATEGSVIKSTKR